MAVPKDTLWPIDPHTIAKHQILRKYLDAWLPILAAYNDQVLYLDGFAGPGEYEGGEQGSPMIALDAALSHQARLARNLVFEFVEERADRAEHLQSCINKLTLPATIHARVVTGTFARTLQAMLDELDARHQRHHQRSRSLIPSGSAGSRTRSSSGCLGRTRVKSS